MFEKQHPDSPWSLPLVWVSQLLHFTGVFEGVGEGRISVSGR